MQVVIDKLIFEFDEDDYAEYCMECPIGGQMTSEPKVRAYVEMRTNPYDHAGIALIRNDKRVGEFSCEDDDQANYIASKINAPDPIAIRQQAVREAIEIVMQKFSGYEETYVVKMKAEIVEAIDQLRNKGV